MGQFLNSKEPYDKFRTVMSGTYFVDKTEILEELIPALQQEQRFFCITRPRRFGKTVMANMIASFFSKGRNAEDVFKTLQIYREKDCQKYMNQYTVIHITFNDLPRKCNSYEQYIDRIEDLLIEDLKKGSTISGKRVKIVIFISIPTNMELQAPMYCHQYRWS